jgi:hypothetical protein
MMALSEFSGLEGRMADVEEKLAARLGNAERAGSKRVAGQSWLLHSL